MATDCPLIGGCHAADYSLPGTRRFIITVLIITGFAKISAKFINSETEAIPPTEIELTASMESWIKSLIGKYCKNQLARRAVGFD